MTTTTTPDSTADPPGPVVPRPVKALSVVSLFNDFASEMVYPLLPQFVARTLGGGAIALGALDGAADLAAAALKWVSGRLADRPGWRRPLILAGYGTAVLIRPVMSIASSAWQVVGFRVLDRVGKGLRTPPRDALIAELTPPSQRGRAFGFHRAADHFGAVVGSLAAWWLLRTGADVRGVIAWSAVPGIVAFVILAALLRTAHGPAASQAHSTPSATARPSGGDAGGLVFWLPVAALAGLTLARLPEALMLLRLQDLGIPLEVIPLLWAALHVVRSAGSYPGGTVTDRLGPRITVAFGGIVFAAVAIALAFSLSPYSAAIVFLVLGLVAGLTEAAERALVARLAPNRLGRGFGAYHALTGFAALPAGLFFGALYQRLGGGTAMAVSAITTLAAVFAWSLVAPREPSSPR